MNNIPWRLERKIMPVTESGCWLWLGYTDAKGYGRICNRYGHTKVHRFMWSLFNGPIPDDFQIDHICRVRCCCNPEHLEPVTNLENCARGERATATMCFRGHLMSDAYWRKGRKDRYQRVCRTCEQIRRL